MVGRMSFILEIDVLIGGLGWIIDNEKPPALLICPLKYRADCWQSYMRAVLKITEQKSVPFRKLQPPMDFFQVLILLYFAVHRDFHFRMHVDLETKGSGPLHT